MVGIVEGGADDRCGRITRNLQSDIRGVFERYVLYLTIYTSHQINVCSIQLCRTILPISVDRHVLEMDPRGVSILRRRTICRADEA